MRAGYLVAPGRIEVRDDALPQAAPGGVVVRVRVALTDGTDLKAYRRGHPKMPMPTRFGHEFSGDVAAIGAGVTAFAVGDGIMSVHSAPDGTCYWCARGEEELCPSVMETKILGAYAEYLSVPKHIVARNAFRKPAHVSYETAAFLEPVSCVVHAQQRLAPRAGDTVAIVGDGGFGILHALVARANGARPILVGRRAERLALARALGIAETIDARATTDVAAALAARTDGRGADAVIECTGAREIWEAAPSYVRRGGTIVLFGGLPGGTPVTFDSSRLHYDEIALLSPFHFTPRAVRAAYEMLAAGALDVEPLVSERFALDRLGDAFSSLDAGRGLNLKYAVLP
ncbi:MAG: alcohol dehydrogenase catalytic domain-containing protein [Vulcanimicrobiaceae bacterium]